MFVDFAQRHLLTLRVAVKCQQSSHRGGTNGLIRVVFDFQPFVEPLQTHGAKELFHSPLPIRKPQNTVVAEHTLKSRHNLRVIVAKSPPLTRHEFAVCDDLAYSGVIQPPIPQRERRPFRSITATLDTPSRDLMARQVYASFPRMEGTVPPSRKEPIMAQRRISMHKVQDILRLSCETHLSGRPLAYSNGPTAGADR